MGGIVGGLLDFGKVILGVFVEGELANFTEGELLVRPNVGQIEDVNLLLLPEFFGLFGGHGLPFYSPRGTVAAVNRFKEILLGVVWRLRLRFLLCQELCALLRLHVHLTVDPLAFLVDKFESVAGVSVHEAVTVRDAAVTHENHHLVDRLGVIREVIPEHCRAGQRLARSAENRIARYILVGTSQVRGRVTLLSVNEMRELGRITQEEHWGVICNHIPVALLCAELDRESPRVTST